MGHTVYTNVFLCEVSFGLMYQINFFKKHYITLQEWGTRGQRPTRATGPPQPPNGSPQRSHREPVPDSLMRCIRTKITLEGNGLVKITDGGPKDVFSVRGTLVPAGAKVKWRKGLKERKLV